MMGKLNKGVTPLLKESAGKFTVKLREGSV
jgi:hypothetical protein